MLNARFRFCLNHNHEAGKCLSCHIVNLDSDVGDINRKMAHCPKFSLVDPVVSVWFNIVK